MFLSNTLSDNLTLLDAGIIAVLGYAVVFFGLILLMLVVMAMGKAFTARGAARKTTQAPAPAPAAPSTPSAPAAPPAAPVSREGAELAPGSAGTIKLHDVPPKTAAMLMAIVADTLGKPLNELRFISIKEVR